MRDDEMRAVLAARDPFQAAPGMPPFTDDEVRRLGALPRVGERLVAVARDAGAPLALRFAAAEALFQGGWDAAARAAGAGADLARLLAEALRADPSHGRWGLPGYFVGRAGRVLLSLGADAVAALAPLLDDRRELSVEGSEEATLQDEHRFRVAELAGYLASTALGEPWPEDGSAAERDAALARVRARAG